MVELMVALVIGLFLMAGVLQIFVTNKVAYKSQDGLARLQENGRFAIEVLTRDLRYAGYFGCAAREAVSPDIIVQGKPADFFGIDSLIGGQNDLGASNAFNAVAGTDALAVRMASQSIMPLGRNMTTSSASLSIDANSENIGNGDILFISDCEKADVFEVSTITGTGPYTITHTTGNATNDLSKPYQTDAQLMSFISNTYFIKDTGRVNEAGDPILGLYRRDVSGSDEELIDGVEDLQLLYGLDTDTDSDQIANQYVTADSIDGTSTKQWRNVVSVRISIVVNSIESLKSIEEAYAAPETHTLTTTINLRNQSI